MGATVLYRVYGVELETDRCGDATYWDAILTNGHLDKCMWVCLVDPSCILSPLPTPVSSVRNQGLSKGDANAAIV